MKNFFKALVLGTLMMAVLMCAAHHWLGFDIVIDNHMVEPLIGMGVVMTAFIITMVVVGLVIAGILGSVLLVGALIAVAVGGVVFLSGMLFSWPVILGLVILWLICRDKPRRRAY